MPVNYLPFIKRSQCVLAAGARVATAISDLSVGGGNRAFLGDMCIGVDGGTLAAPGVGWGVDTQLPMRIGLLKRGYLTESFYISNMYKDGVYPESGVWRFPKPYMIFPGQRMKALITIPAGSGFDLVNYAFIPAIAFHGRRVVDNQPITLYDRAVGGIVAGGSSMLNGETLQCPADSPVELYSVVRTADYDRYPRPDAVGSGTGSPQIFQEFTGGMIWGPDDRQWWDQIAWTQVVNPPVTLIDLNRPEWVLLPDEGITVEFWNDTGSAATIWVTLRGSLEVTT